MIVRATIASVASSSSMTSGANLIVIMDQQHHDATSSTNHYSIEEEEPHNDRPHLVHGAATTAIPETAHWSPKVAFLLVSFTLGVVGDGLNVFQGIYLVGTGWNEGSVGIALSLMGFTMLLMQPLAGNWVDQTVVDRRIFLGMASAMTSVSASTVLLVRPGNYSSDHTLIFISKIVEGISASFIGPCVAALTLANFGPKHFDTIIASNILWGHIGVVVAAILAGLVAYIFYPNVKYCFLIIAAAALSGMLFIPFLPQGDPMMGRGFQGKVAIDETGQLEKLTDDDDEKISLKKDSPPIAASYRETLSCPKTGLLCVTGLFFHFANANVLVVLGELMGQGGDDGMPSRNAIPLIAGAIATAQVTMAIATWIGNRLTRLGCGRKPLFMAGLLSLPIRCALIIWWKDAGNAWLLSTQILDGLGGGLFGLLHPYLVADITFGTGRFNLVMGLTASCFGLGAALSNFLGQVVVERYGHVASLIGSFFISFLPIALFCFMPETFGLRGMKPNVKVIDDAAVYKLAID